ncbi:MAG: zinc ribbon domain-containing protein [Myxococcaceae bacterium]|nr:zinc ribbon domain-containing protein [Myxococcaceae bacterium]
MPEYEYFCRHCQLPFTSAMSVKQHDERMAECPVCHQSKEVEKRIAHVYTVTSRKSAAW